MNKKDERSIVQEWLDKAEEDARSAGGILHHREGAASAVCFHSQQLAEKSLKALLQFRGEMPPKVHDLLQLETLVALRMSKVEEYHEQLLFLNRYYIESRYPGDFPEFSWNEAQEALNAARMVQQFCEESIFENSAATSCSLRKSWWQRFVQRLFK